jgi:hypothetical protein
MKTEADSIRNSEFVFIVNLRGRTNIVGI